MKTYFLNKPCLCFTCARVFDRIDCHIWAKHAHRGSEEYYEILKMYRERSDELLFASRSFEKDSIHNLRSKIQEVKSVDYKDYVCHCDQATCSSTSLKEASGSSSFKSAATERAPGSSSNTAATERAPGSSSNTAATERAPCSSSHTVATGSVSGSSSSHTATGPSTTSTQTAQKPGPTRLRGKFVSPKLGAKSILLKNKLEMSSEFRKKHKLHNRHDFRYYYENSNNILKDFKNYLVVQVRYNQKQASQYRNNVTQIWTAVDSNRAIFPRNYLRDTDILKDYFYRPLYVSLQESLKLPKEEQSPYIQAATIKSKLCLLSVFCRFLINRGLFIN